MRASVGFIGLGNMGGRMARRLKDAGYEVTGFDIRPGRAEELGLIPADSVAGVCTAPVILLSLPDSTAVEVVIGGDDGVLANAQPGSVVVDTTSGEPAVSARLHTLLAEKGVDYLDVGISGGVPRAENGTLSMMVGGSPAALDAVRSVLSVLSDGIFYMGRPGNGHATKAVNNFLNGLNLAATAEAMVVGVKAGLDPALLLAVINASSGRNWASENRFPHIIQGNYLEGGLTCSLQAKDLDIYNKLARTVRAPNFIGEICRSVYTAAIGMGYADQISNRVVDALGDIAGGVRLFQADGDAGTSRSGKGG